eukprot:1133016-Prymnesium_polylepis.1
MEPVCCLDVLSSIVALMRWTAASSPPNRKAPPSTAAVDRLIVASCTVREPDAIKAAPPVAEARELSIVLPPVTIISPPISAIAPPQRSDD